MALADASDGKRVVHVPYRDSKLTRILQARFYGKAAWNDLWNYWRIARCLHAGLLGCWVADLFGVVRLFCVSYTVCCTRRAVQVSNYAV